MLKLKVITFGVMHFSIAFALAYIVTGSWVVGGILAILEPGVNTLAYLVHEKVWNWIDTRKAEA